MSEIKLTEDQEREIWENAPRWAEWFAISRHQQYYYYQFKPKMHYPEDGGMHYYISSAGLFEFAESVNCNMFATKAVTDICFKCPDKYLKKNADKSCLNCIFSGNVSTQEFACTTCHEYNYWIWDEMFENTKANTYKPDYYLRAGEQYQPNRISDAYNLEGSKNQALKYLLRAGHKPIEGKTEIECEIIDLNKAKQQLIDRIEFLEGLE